MLKLLNLRLLIKTYISHIKTKYRSSINLYALIVKYKIGEYLLTYKKKINIIAQIHENIWNNKKTIQLNIKDLIL